MECQEPGCRAPAVKDWNGRKVCSDHYDKYRDESINFMDDS
ncbi:MAG TPA: hypothetical protein VJB08_04335 [Candidatus Nanoarchaeia archaeon]|nr:hypothetical protein [Candidatus Nanoarchaeia archaeon]